MKKNQVLERIIHAIFLLLGLITVGCVLLITVYLVISGIPAIRKIGLADFLFGKEWASTAAEPKYGILPFILTSVYGTAGAIIIGVPVGFMTAVYLSKLASPKVKATMQTAVSLRREEIADFIFTLYYTSVSKYKFSEDGRERISFVNDISHLHGLMGNIEDKM